MNSLSPVGGFLYLQPVCPVGLARVTGPAQGRDGPESGGGTHAGAAPPWPRRSHAPRIPLQKRPLAAWLLAEPRPGSLQQLL